MNVDASTISAAQLFSTSVFSIPDFQREYSWGPDDEVGEFWSDLSGSIDSPPYFLGLLIVTDEDGRRVVVDGQQRLTTLTLLANSLRRAALAAGKSLIADSMRDVFLFHLDYETEQRHPRMQATAAKDAFTLAALLADRDPEPGLANPLLVKAQRDLDAKLTKDLGQHDASARLAKWARFISGGLSFALFEHPNRNAAYKVYEVVNTRGRDLTPSELIKSYLIGTTPIADQQTIYDRWVALETSFTDVGAGNQFTQFVRHIVTLRHGYVIPRDLYQEITTSYAGVAGVDELLCELEEHLPVYMQMVDPATDRERRDDSAISAFSMLDALGLRTIRPIFQAAAESGEPEDALDALIRIVVPRLAMGTFGTGSIERRFADDARDIHEGAEWRDVIAQLRQDLAPSRRSFTQRLEEAPLSKSFISVLRHSVLQRTTMPTLEGYAHVIRPKNAQSWPGFSDAEFRRLGGTIGNTMLLETERRPRNTHTFVGASERLFPAMYPLEQQNPELVDPRQFTPAEVESQNARLASEAADLWYAGA